MNLSDIPFDDRDTWDLLQSGRTLGVFQCESKLLQDWIRKFKPSNLWELSAVISLVRPGALMSGACEEYAKNKFNKSEIESFGDKTIDEILHSNYGVLCYQENLMTLGSKIAWRHLGEMEQLIKADTLRKSVGKKNQAEILKIGKDFYDGCVLNGLDPEIATKLLSIIKNSGRYLFNLSHAFSYAYITYYTAYLKVHYPQHFYLTYMNFSEGKIDPDLELSKLIQDARSNNFTILPPNINKKNLDFVAEGNDKIRFALSYVKAVANSLNDIIKDIPYIDNWKQVLGLAHPDSKYKIRSTAMEALILSGAFSDTLIGRNKLFHAYEFIDCLSPKEKIYLLDNLYKIDNIEDIYLLIEEISEKVSVKKRKQIVLSEAKILKENLQKDDHPLWIESLEQKYLNSVISGSITSPYEHISEYNCYEASLINREASINTFSMVAVIDDIQIHVVKTGKNAGKQMCKLTIHDSTGSLENVVVFAKNYSVLQNLITREKVIHFRMRHSPNTGLVVDDILEI